MNFIYLIFLFMTIFVTISANLFVFIENKLPKVYLKLFRFGKFAYREQISGIASKAIVEVPKSWFKHFYVIAVIIYTYIFYLVTSVYVFNTDVPKWFNVLLNVTGGQERIAHVSVIKTYIAILLMTLQVYRRYYDTHFVSIFGNKSKINLSHYVVGIVHYPGTALAIICEAPKFASATPIKTIGIHITFLDIFAILLFFWAWWHQHVCTKILANLRKDKKGNIVSNSHHLPNGDWFNYLSAPHQTAEILMYFSLTVLLWNNSTWFVIFTWVISNQVLAILLSHWWYQETFAQFPKTRKALIPFLY